MFKGNDESQKKYGMAHFNDLSEAYAKQMAWHGCGSALYHPVSTRDMTPPCAGFFDRNGDWNLICNLSTSPQAQKPLHPTVDGAAPSPPFAPLKYDPVMSTQINIEWQPKTSQDVEAIILAGGGQTPDNLPAGADVQIRYQSKSKFGAVLMTLRPITLHAYNDERLFLDWLECNRALLFDAYGAQLKKYGLWLVTRTYNAPGCSINAWQNSNKESQISLKAKASMLGELGNGEMQLNDHASDKDWSHYKAQQGDALVVFMDGIEVTKTEWYIEGVRQKLSRRSPSASGNSSPSRRASGQYVLSPQVGAPLEEQRRRASAYLAPPPNGHLSPADNGLTVAHNDVGVMPTWSEGTAEPTTHGGTRPRGLSETGSRRGTATATGNAMGAGAANGAVTGPTTRAPVGYEYLSYAEEDVSISGGSYLITSPIQKKQARTNTGFGSIFTKMDAPLPWSPDDPAFASPVVDQDTLADAGFQPLSLSRRSLSVRRRGSDASSSDTASIARRHSRARSTTPSVASSKTAATSPDLNADGRPRSLRRDKRSISGDSTAATGPTHSTPSGKHTAAVAHANASSSSRRRSMAG